MALDVLHSFVKAFVALVLAVTLLAVFAPAWAEDETLSYGGRDLIVHVPAHLPPSGTRALVMVLHGGLGNAGRIAGQQSESGINLDAEADRDGFIVTYLNGTPVTRLLGGNFLGWNAGGGCCGIPAQKDVDDVSYIKGAAAFLADRYGVNRFYGIGHSNGAMMVQRLMCETDLLAAAIAISGPLNLDAAACPAARGKHILAIHGADDQNVPVAGGKGTRGLSNASFNSEMRSRAAFAASGATYTLDEVAGADHFLDHIDAAVRKSEGVSIAQKAARFFGLAP